MMCHPFPQALDKDAEEKRKQQLARARKRVKCSRLRLPEPFRGPNDDHIIVNSPCCPRGTGLSPWSPLAFLQSSMSVAPPQLASPCPNMSLPVEFGSVIPGSPSTSGHGSDLLTLRTGLSWAPRLLGHQTRSCPPLPPNAELALWRW